MLRCCPACEFFPKSCVGFPWTAHSLSIESSWTLVHLLSGALEEGMHIEPGVTSAIVASTHCEVFAAFFVVLLWPHVRLVPFSCVRLVKLKLPGSLPRSYVLSGWMLASIVVQSRRNGSICSVFIVHPCWSGLNCSGSVMDCDKPA